MLRIILLQASLAVALAAAASADESRLLPFWAEPYPSGYVHRDTDCLQREAVATRRGTAYRLVDICQRTIRSLD